MSGQVVLVDENDTPVGTADKIQAHRAGLLHRAFSVFVADRRNRLLLQQRAAGKYHSGGLWSNTCCSHPGPGEDVLAAARRRLQDEMGLRCELAFVFRFLYRAEMAGGWIEHELDHVFLGRVDEDPTADPGEVQAWRWVAVQQLAEDLCRHPERFTPWLPIAMGHPELREVLR
jgi:isopentenyl-diphosphate Delta-isomerase